MAPLLINPTLPEKKRRIAAVRTGGRSEKNCW